MDAEEAIFFRYFGEHYYGEWLPVLCEVHRTTTFARRSADPFRKLKESICQGFLSSTTPHNRAFAL